MKELEKYHSSAMDFAEQAVLARRLGADEDKVQALFRQAFEYERQAAMLLLDDLSSEPSRSIMFRSAASLAIDCRETREAERLIAIGLLGDPPHEIAEELRDLLEQVNFHRHLSLRGLSLDEDEFQISIAGKAVGYGIALSDLFVSRIQTVEKLVFRTAERLADKAFREKGPPKKTFREELELFVCAPTAGSLAVTFKLGRPTDQQRLPGLALSVEVVDELMECLDVFNQSGDEELRRRIADTAYYRNFLALAREMAPDGEQITQVGFTTIRKGRETRLALTRQRGAIPAVHLLQPVDQRGEFASIEGRLRYADSTHPEKGQIRLVDEQDRQHKIIVPEGLMNDIVRPLWDYKVIVEGKRIGHMIHLQDIREAPEQ